MKCLQVTLISAGNRADVPWDEEVIEVAPFHISSRAEVF
jgi:hypothetical protein